MFGIDNLKKLLASLFPGGSGSNGRDQITCEEALAHLWEYLDGELEGIQKERVEEHLRVCQRCYPRLRFDEAFLEALRRAKEGKSAPEHVRNRVLETLKEEGLSPD